MNRKERREKRKVRTIGGGRRVALDRRKMEIEKEEGEKEKKRKVVKQMRIENTV